MLKRSKILDGICNRKVKCSSTLIEVIQHHNIDWVMVHTCPLLHMLPLLISVSALHDLRKL